MPDAMVAWELECNVITISKLESEKAATHQNVDKLWKQIIALQKEVKVKAETIRKQAKQIERLVEGLYSVRRSTEIMEARRFAEEALKKE